MSKLNKIISCLIPITTIGALAPVMVGCGKPALSLKFGDSINCLSNKEQFSDVALHSYNEVFNAVKVHADIETEKEEVSIATLNLPENKNFQKMFWDLVAGKLKSELAIYLNVSLSTDGKSFETFNLWEAKYNDPADEPEQVFNSAFGLGNIEYVKGDGNLVALKVSIDGQSMEVPSYTYQYCKAID